MSTVIIITTLNEITGVKKIVPQINREWAEEIIFVDGGSTDGTIEEAKKMGFEVVMQKQSIFLKRMSPLFGMLFITVQLLKMLW
jgi:glycosyltransferase involved in cell wall biosynthesis